MTNLDNGFGQARAFFLPGEVFPEDYLFIAFFKSAPTFPYGFDVEPDLHT